MSASIPAHESLAVEFKSDRKRLPDAELVEAVLYLANVEGSAQLRDLGEYRTQRLVLAAWDAGEN